MKVDSLMASLRFHSCALATAGILCTGVVSSTEEEKLSGSDRRWLEREAAALITEEEVQLFHDLDSKDRQRFRELFWLRRDPDLMTPQNELREEYEKRRKSADRSFRQLGVSGSDTDMGKVFLLLGFPSLQDGRRSEGMGGLRFLAANPTAEASSDAAAMESGTSLLNAALASGMTTTWSYEPNLELGIPEGLTVQFEQQQDLGYRFRDLEAVTETLERVKERLVFQPGIDYARDDQGRLMDLPAKFDPRSPAKKAFREMIETKIEKTDIVFETEMAFFRATEGTYVPVRFEIDPERLSWDGDVADVTLFGAVETADGQELYRFEEPAKLSQNVDGPSLYDLPVQLEPGSYTFRLGILDDESGRVGTKTLPIFVRNFEESSLDMSSVLLYTESNEVDEPPGTAGRSFQFGQVCFTPACDNTFTPADTMGILFFVYGFGLNPQDRPDLTCDYVLFKGEEKLSEVPNQSLQAGTKQAIARLEFPLESFRPGKYRVQIKVTDKVSGEVLTDHVEFLLEPEFYPVGEYSDLVDSYRKGEFLEAAEALSRVHKDSLERATRDYRKGSLGVQNLKAAALIHTEVAFLTRKDVLFHLNSARDYLSRIQEPALQNSLLRRWYLAVSSLLRGTTQSWSALHLAQDASKMFPDDLEILLAVGSVYDAAAWMGIPGMLERAEALYREILDDHPENDDAHLRLGRVLQLKGDGEAALHELERGLEHTTDPETRFVAHMLLGETNSRLGRAREAIRFYRSALETDPNCQAAAVALSHALHRAGDRDASRAVIRQLLVQETGPQNKRQDRWMRFLFGEQALLDSAMRETRRELLQ